MSDKPYRYINRRAGSADHREPAPQAVSPGLYATPRNTGNLDWYRPRPYRYADISETLNDYDWYDMLALSRQLFAQVGDLAAAIIQKAVYAVGEAWKPNYAGRNAKWGEEATEWLIHEWYPNCDARGGIYDFGTNLFLSSLSWDVDGDNAVIFAKDVDTGAPLLKHLAAYSMGSRGYQDEVKEGTFKGAKIKNGIILDRNDKFLGVNITGKKPDDDQQIPAANCHLLYEPNWQNQYRGIPPLGRVLMDGLDVADIDFFLKRIIKKEASYGMLISTETGEPGPNSDLLVERTPPTDGTSSGPPVDVRIERRLGGEDFFLKANAGEKVETLKSDRPSTNSEAFTSRINRRIMLGIGWFIELLDPSKIGGASVRLIQDQARHSIRSRQKTLRLAATRKVQWAVACAMETKRISRNNDGGDWMRWAFNVPAQITVDQGYDEKADQDNLRVGSTTLAAIAQKKGGTWQHLRQQRGLENQNWIDQAVQLVQYALAAGQVLSFSQALDMVQQNSPNPRPPDGAGESDRSDRSDRPVGSEKETP